MFSALVLIQHGPKGAPSGEGVVRTLSALVPAAIEGIVRDVALASPVRSEDLSRIADLAGCAYVHASADALVRESLAALKGPRILALRAGRVPEQGFLDELADLANNHARQSAVLLDPPHSILARLLPRLSRASGLAAPRGALAGTRGDLAAMAKALASPVVFKARMIGED